MLELEDSRLRNSIHTPATGRSGACTIRAPAAAVDASPLRGRCAPAPHNGRRGPMRHTMPFVGHGDDVVVVEMAPVRVPTGRACLGRTNDVAVEPARDVVMV